MKESLDTGWEDGEFQPLEEFPVLEPGEVLKLCF